VDLAKIPEKRRLAKYPAETLSGSRMRATLTYIASTELQYTFAEHGCPADRIATRFTHCGSLLTVAIVRPQ